MRIGVTSDTHSRNLPKQMLDDFKDTELIIHTGDFCDFSALEMLEKIAPVKGICGNMDSEEISKRFPKKEILEIDGKRIGVTHGDGPAKVVAEKVKDVFKKDKVDAVVFGHSHHPMNEMVEGVLYFNPGSPNDTIFSPYCSYGILDVTPDGVKGNIVKVES